MRQGCADRPLRPCRPDTAAATVTDFKPRANALVGIRAQSARKRPNPDATASVTTPRLRFQLTQDRGPNMIDRQHIVIVGGGFSGTALSGAPAAPELREVRCHPRRGAPERRTRNRIRHTPR